MLFWLLSLMPQVYVAFNFSTSTLFTLIVVLSTTITIGFHRIVIILYICCNSCGVPVHKNMSSAKRIWLRNYPSIFTPFFSQLNLLIFVLSGIAVNSLGEIVSPCITPILILIVSLSLCSSIVTELSVYVFQDSYVRLHILC